MDNKTFVARLAKQLDTDPNQVSKLVSCLGLIIKERAADLDSIALPGFGNFVAMKRQEHIVYDSNTGKRMLMPPNISVEFVAGSKLRKQVSYE